MGSLLSLQPCFWQQTGCKMCLLYVSDTVSLDRGLSGELLGEFNAASVGFPSAVEVTSGL